MKSNNENTGKPAALLGSIGFASVYALIHTLRIHHILAAFSKATVGCYLSWLV